MVTKGKHLKEQLGRLLQKLTLSDGRLITVKEEPDGQRLDGPGHVLTVDTNADPDTFDPPTTPPPSLGLSIDSSGNLEVAPGDITLAGNLIGWRTHGYSGSFAPAFGLPSTVASIEGETFVLSGTARHWVSVVVELDNRDEVDGAPATTRAQIPRDVAAPAEAFDLEVSTTQPTPSAWSTGAGDEHLTLKVPIGWVDTVEGQAVDVVQLTTGDMLLIGHFQGTLYVQRYDARHFSHNGASGIVRTPAGVKIADTLQIAGNGLPGFDGPSALWQHPAAGGAAYGIRPRIDALRIIATPKSGAAGIAFDITANAAQLETLTTWQSPTPSKTLAEWENEAQLLFGDGTDDGSPLDITAEGFYETTLGVRLRLTIVGQGWIEFTIAPDGESMVLTPGSEEYRLEDLNVQATANWPFHDTSRALNLTAEP